MTPNILIRQPAGLGDIFYCQKIAKYFADKGNTVFWPVIPQYSFIVDYIKYPGIIYSHTNDYNIVIDLQSAFHIVPNKTIMGSKYALVDIESSDWLDFFTFNRDEKKEDELYNMKVNNEKYCLICNTFASPPHEVKRDLDIETTLPTVCIEAIKGFNPFDWCKIIENATEIHLVDTCFTFFVEKLYTKAKKLCLYPRIPYHTEIITKELWKKDWNYAH